MKALIGAFNKEKSLVGTFTVIVNTDGWFAAHIRSVLTPTLGPRDIVTRRNGVIIIVIGHNIAPANDTQQAAPRGYRQKVAGQDASVICLQYINISYVWLV